MTEEVKGVLDLLRYFGEKEVGKRGDVPAILLESNLYMEDIFSKAASLVESMAAQIDQLTDERDGLSIMLTSASSAADTYKCERDAAITDLKEADRFECEHCAHYDNTCCETNCYECLENTCPCQGCTDLSNWKWRGGQNCWNGAQAVDAVEVEIVHHGYWIDDRTDVVCSHCKTCFKDEIDFIQGSDGGRPKRCPECRAKMDLRCEHGN